MRMPGLGRAERVDDRGVLVGLRNETGMPKVGRQLGLRRTRNESEGNALLVEARCDLEALPVRQIHIEEREVEMIGQMPAGRRQIAANVDDLVADAFEEHLEIEGDERIVFKDQNSQEPLRSTLLGSAVSARTAAQRAGLRHRPADIFTEGG
jgi:hypothetical protein